MLPLLFLTFYFSSFIVYTECGQSDIFQVIRSFRATNGIDRKSDNLRRYSSFYTFVASKQLKLHSFDDNKNISSLRLLTTGYAAIFGLANAPGALSYDIGILNAIVGEIASKGNSHFLLDIAYEEVTIHMGEERDKGVRPYCLLFTIPRTSVRKLMAKRISNVAPIENSFFGTFDRLTYYFCSSVDFLSEDLLSGVKKDKIDSEIISVIDVSIPEKDVNSWDDVVRYLASGKNQVATTTILDPYNFSVAMNYQWLCGSLRVVMAFEKWKRSGERSVFENVLNKIKDARSKKGIENDLLLNAFPTLEANEIAEAFVKGDNRSLTTVLCGRTEYCDKGREDTSRYMINEFEKISEDWINAAQDPKNIEDQKNSATIFHGHYTSIGFAAKVIVDEDDKKPYWSFCIFFSGKSDA